MIIFDTNNKPILLDSIHAPLATEHMWVLDFNLMDFTLSPVTVLEQFVSPAHIVRIKGFEFPLPSTWNILVYDRETSQIDVVEVLETAGREFHALIYGPKKANFGPGIITVTNYYPELLHVAPSLNKHQMLCHPIGPDEWISVAPSDAHNKYLKDKVVGDLVGY